MKSKFSAVDMMKAKKTFKAVVVGLVATGALVLNANAHAVTLDAGVFGSTMGDLGTATNPRVFNVNPSTGLFLDTINFDLGTWTHFNMTSTVTGITFFGAPIFENNNDTEVVLASATHLSLFLPDLGLPRDYHLHPQGVDGGAGSYGLSLWGSTAPVPIPAAVYLFGSGLIGLVGLARRKMRTAV
jgi:hypothetical protein